MTDPVRGDLNTEEQEKWTLHKAAIKRIWVDPKALLGLAVGIAALIWGLANF